jgi:hypothetical protein
MAALSKIKRVGVHMASLLEAAGIDSVKVLADQNANALSQKLVKVNAQRKIVRRLPSSAQLTDWIAQARKLSEEPEFLIEADVDEEGTTRGSPFDDGEVFGYGVDGELPGDVSKPNKP